MEKSLRDAHKKMARYVLQISGKNSTCNETTNMMMMAKW